MPKVNVYLPDELATAVKAASIPVSTVCQRALEDALRASTALREGARAEVSGLPGGVRLGGYPTPRLVHALNLAFDAARAREHGFVGTEHLLIGMLDEGENLGVRVIGAMDVGTGDVRSELDAMIHHALPDPPSGEPALTPRAVRALDLTSEEARNLGHNYLGCEHLLLGLIGETEGIAGRVLRTMGLDRVVTRRAVTTALSGFVHARANPPTAATTEASTVASALADISTRLDRIETRLDAA